MSRLAPTVQAFFTSYLVGQKAASAHTISAYRDTWRLLLRYLHDQHQLSPDRVDFTDLHADTIIGFLAHLDRAAATARPPGTPAWPRSTPCSATPPTHSSSTPT